MNASRPVRIPRGGPPLGDRPVRVPVARAAVAAAPTSPSTTRANPGGMQRANRLAIVFSAGLLGVYGALALYARSAPGGYGPGATQDLALFGGVALLLAAVGILLSLSGAPRRFELRPDATLVFGRLGGRLVLPPLSELDVRVVRRFPASLLSPTPTVHLEVSPRRKGRRRAFLVEEGLLDSGPATPGGGG